MQGPEAVSPVGDQKRPGEPTAGPEAKRMKLDQGTCSVLLRRPGLVLSLRLSSLLGVKRLPEPCYSLDYFFLCF